VKVFIYCGVPGSGKTTHIAKEHRNASGYSADTFFEHSDGTYRFDLAKLPRAHGYCLRGYLRALQEGRREIVVDNTNTTVAEIAPYAALALAFGFELEIITIECSVEIAAARNIHGVPLASVQGAADRLAKRELPPWWPQRTIRSQIVIGPNSKLHPFCRKCGWRKGGIDSWDGKACKCGHSEPPYQLCATCGPAGSPTCPTCDGSGLIGPISRFT
jgi:hypothetical protein